MKAGDAAQRLGDAFDAEGLPYAIGGALALGAWGAIRQTLDVDVSVFVSPAEYDRLADTLERAGVLFDRARGAAELARIGLLRGRLGHVVVDVFVSEHPHFEEMRLRRRPIASPSGTLSFISPEDLVVMKLVYGRPKDLVDLERLYAVRPGLDASYIRGWLARMPVRDDMRAAFDDLERRFARTSL